MSPWSGGFRLSLTCWQQRVPAGRWRTLFDMVLPQVCVTYLLRESEGVPEVLLGRKRRGLGVGKLVGLGGKLHPGEHPRSAAVREIDEESGLFVAKESLQPVGMLTYLFPTKPAWSQESWVYLCRDWIGEPVDSDELSLSWYSVAKLPLGEMWSDAQYWLPAALRGTFTRTSFVFGADLSTAVACDNPDFGLPAVPPPGSLSGK